MGKAKGPIIHWVNENTRSFPRPACNTINPITQCTENKEEVTCGMCKKSIEKLKKKVQYDYK